jgi:hypothetical protein
VSHPLKPRKGHGSEPQITVKTMSRCTRTFRLTTLPVSEILLSEVHFVNAGSDRQVIDAPISISISVAGLVSYPFRGLSHDRKGAFKTK